MPTKTILYAVAGLAVAVLFGISAIRGHAPHNASEWLSPIGPAVAAASIGLWLFDRFLWRWPGIRRLVGRPVLHGTWHGELTSDWVDPETQRRIPADPDVLLVVRQRFWRVSVRLLTKESASSSILANFNADADGVHQLIYVYANTPRSELRDRSELHYGAVVLGAPRDPNEALEGHYFTDRKTRGEMCFRRRFAARVETHAAGRELVASPRTSRLSRWRASPAGRCQQLWRAARRGR
jgi:SMODS-associating 2TM, beta-strand rich effector domain